MDLSKIKDSLKALKGRLSNRIEAATDAKPDIGSIEARFREIQGQRVSFLDEAKLMAELVMPGMYEGSAADGVDSTAITGLWGSGSFTPPNQSLISKGVLLLSWSMANVKLPADGSYFSRKISQAIVEEAQALERARVSMGDTTETIPIPEQFSQTFLQQDNVVKQTIAASNHQETLAACELHSIVSGLSVFGHLSLYEAKCYTIQNCAVVFDDLHEPLEVIVVDRVPIVSLPDVARRKLVTKSEEGQVEDLPSNDQFVKVFTRQIRQDRTTLRVETEVEGILIPEMDLEVPANAPILIPIPFMFLNGADPYPIGWLSYNRGDCNAYENLSLAVEGMVETAALSLLPLKPSSRVTSEDIRGKVGLEVLHIGDEATRPPDIITSPIANNLAQVMSWHDKKERQLMMTFGMDFAIQRPGERVTAEEIQRLSAGLQKLFGASFKQGERTWQHKHVRRQFKLAEEAGLVTPIPDDSFSLVLTAGLNQLKTQNDITKMDTLLARAQLFGEPGLLSVGKDATLSWYANRLGIESDGIVLSNEEQAEQLGIGQLVTMARQMGPQGPSIIAQIINQQLQQMMSASGGGQTTP